MPIHKITVMIVLMAFILTSVRSPAYAQLAPEGLLIRLPVPGVMVHLSPEFTPAHLLGMTIHPNNALQFDFLINKGDQILDNDQKKVEYKKLVKYFLASLTIPDEDQWVNLSPYEKNRIIKDDFGKTEMGRDLLAQDYMLKQITSSMIYPEDGLGKKFWDKIYERAWSEYHTTQIPVNTFNKVWIIPDQAIVYESGNSAYILKSHLKVMLEEDYLSLQKHTAISVIASAAKQSPYNKDVNTIGSQVIRAIILPELEKEVNEGKNFANLRQMFSGMILATWYKKALKQSLLGLIYADKAKVQGVTGFKNADPKVIASEAKQSQEQIYQQYLKAFKKGVFNYIKEDLDKYTNESIPRKYFSGGWESIHQTRFVTSPADFSKGNLGEELVVQQNTWNLVPRDILTSTTVSTNTDNVTTQLASSTFNLQPQNIAHPTTPTMTLQKPSSTSTGGDAAMESKGLGEPNIPALTAQLSDFKIRLNEDGGVGTKVVTSIVLTPKIVRKSTDAVELGRRIGALFKVPIRVQDNRGDGADNTLTILPDEPITREQLAASVERDLYDFDIKSKHSNLNRVLASLIFLLTTAADVKKIFTNLDIDYARGIAEANIHAYLHSSQSTDQNRFLLFKQIVVMYGLENAQKWILPQLKLALEQQKISRQFYDSVEDIFESEGTNLLFGPTGFNAAEATLRTSSRWSMLRAARELMSQQKTGEIIPLLFSYGSIHQMSFDKNVFIFGQRLKFTRLSSLPTKAIVVRFGKDVVHVIREDGLIEPIFDNENHDIDFQAAQFDDELIIEKHELAKLLIKHLSVPANGQVTIRHKTDQLLASLIILLTDDSEARDLYGDVNIGQAEVNVSRFLQGNYPQDHVFTKFDAYMRRRILLSWIIMMYGPEKASEWIGSSLLEAEQAGHLEVGFYRIAANMISPSDDAAFDYFETVFNAFPKEWAMAYGALGNNLFSSEKSREIFPLLYRYGSIEQIAKAGAPAGVEKGKKFIIVTKDSDQAYELVLEDINSLPDGTYFIEGRQKDGRLVRITDLQFESARPDNRLPTREDFIHELKSNLRDTAQNENAENNRLTAAAVILLIENNEADFSEYEINQAEDVFSQFIHGKFEPGHPALELFQYERRELYFNWALLIYHLSNNSEDNISWMGTMATMLKRLFKEGKIDSDFYNNGKKFTTLTGLSYLRENTPLMDGDWAVIHYHLISEEMLKRFISILHSFDNLEEFSKYSEKRKNVVDHQFRIRRHGMSTVSITVDSISETMIKGRNVLTGEPVTITAAQFKDAQFIDLAMTADEIAYEQFNRVFVDFQRNVLVGMNTSLGQALSNLLTMISPIWEYPEVRKKGIEDLDRAFDQLSGVNPIDKTIKWADGIIANAPPGVTEMGDNPDFDLSQFYKSHEFTTKFMAKVLPLRVAYYAYRNSIATQLGLVIKQDVRASSVVSAAAQVLLKKDPLNSPAVLEVIRQIGILDHDLSNGSDDITELMRKLAQADSPQTMNRLMTEFVFRRGIPYAIWPSFQFGTNNIITWNGESVAQTSRLQLMSFYLKELIHRYQTASEREDLVENAQMIVQLLRGEKRSGEMQAFIIAQGHGQPDFQLINGVQNYLIHLGMPLQVTPEMMTDDIPTLANMLADAIAKNYDLAMNASEANDKLFEDFYEFMTKVKGNAEDVQFLRHGLAQLMNSIMWAPRRKFTSQDAKYFISIDAAFDKLTDFTHRDYVIRHAKLEVGKYPAGTDFLILGGDPALAKFLTTPAFTPEVMEAALALKESYTNYRNLVALQLGLVTRTQLNSAPVIKITHQIANLDMLPVMLHNLRVANYRELNTNMEKFLLSKGVPKDVWPYFTTSGNELIWNHKIVGGRVSSESEFILDQDLLRTLINAHKENLIAKYQIEENRAELVESAKSAVASLRNEKVSGFLQHYLNGQAEQGNYNLHNAIKDYLIELGIPFDQQSVNSILQGQVTDVPTIAAKLADAITKAYDLAAFTEEQSKLISYFGAIGLAMSDRIPKENLLTAIRAMQQTVLNDFNAPRYAPLNSLITRISVFLTQSEINIDKDKSSFKEAERLELLKLISPLLADVSIEGFQLVNAGNIKEAIAQVAALPADNRIVMIVNTPFDVSNEAVIQFLTSRGNHILALKGPKGVGSEFVIDKHRKAVGLDGGLRGIPRGVLDSFGIEVPENGILDPFDWIDREGLKTKIAKLQQLLGVVTLEGLQRLENNKFKTLAPNGASKVVIAPEDGSYIFGERAHVYANVHVLDLRVVDKSGTPQVVRLCGNSPVITDEVKVLGVGPTTIKAWGRIIKDAKAVILVGDADEFGEALREKSQGQIRLHISGNDLEAIKELEHPEIWKQTSQQKIATILRDFALGSGPGGIDFNAANMDLQIRRDGRGVPLPINQQDMAQLAKIQGFVPEIIDIRPADNVPIINELRQKLQNSLPAMANPA